MSALLPLSWDEIRQELWAAYQRGVLHLTIELANGATLEIISQRLGAMPGPHNLAGCRVLILRPL